MVRTPYRHPSLQTYRLNVLTLEMAIDLAEAVAFADSRQAAHDTLLDSAAQHGLADGESLLRALHRTLSAPPPALPPSSLGAPIRIAHPLLLSLAKRLDAAHPQQALFAMVQAQALACAILHLAKQELLRQAASNGFFASSKPKIDACADCLTAAIEVLHTYALSYSALPVRFWLDCHRVYRYLLSSGWENKVASGKTDTLGTLYRQLLLLGVAASNRLDPLRIEALLKLIREGGKQAQLLPLASAQDGIGFILDLERDAAPRHSSLPRKPGPEAALFLLGIHRVLQFWEEKSQSVTQLDAAAQLEQQLILKLRQELVYPPQRRHLRLHGKTQEFVQLHATLAQCWQALQASAGDHAAVAAAPAARMQVCNMSASGYLLRGRLPDMPLRSGELVLIQRAGRDNLLGLVRWINRQSPCGEVECGIEISGQNPEAILVKPVVTYATEQAQAAIRLAASSRLNPQDVLVMHGKPYQALRQFEIHQDDTIRPVKASRLLCQTAYYQLMEVRSERH